MGETEEESGGEGWGGMKNRTARQWVKPEWAAVLKNIKKSRCSCWPFKCHSSIKVFRFNGDTHPWPGKLLLLELKDDGSDVSQEKRKVTHTQNTLIELYIMQIRNSLSKTETGLWRAEQSRLLQIFEKWILCDYALKCVIIQICGYQKQEVENRIQCSKNTALPVFTRFHVNVCNK